MSKTLVRGVYQRGLEELAKMNGIELTVITPPSWREGRTVTRLERQFTRGYSMVETPIAFNGHYHVYFYPRLRRCLDQIRPDLVHVDEEPYNLATYFALRAARSLGAKRLFYAWQNINRTLPLPFALLERANYALAGGAIAANEDAAGVLRRKGFDRPIAVIPPGLDPDLYVPSTNGSTAAFRIGYIGRLVLEKGVDLLLRACHTLDQPWTLTIVGEGSEERTLRKLAGDLKIVDRVAFRSPIPSGEVPELLRDLDALVLPSRSLPTWREQFGRILMEAMACEVPVVGSTCGEIPRVIGDGGLVFPENDVDALAERLRRLQSQPDFRRELGLAGRARVLSHFTHRRIALKTFDVYRLLVDSPT